MNRRTKPHRIYADVVCFLDELRGFYLYYAIRKLSTTNKEFDVNEQEEYFFEKYQHILLDLHCILISQKYTNPKVSKSHYFRTLTMMMKEKLK